MKTCGRCGAELAVTGGGCPNCATLAFESDSEANKSVWGEEVDTDRTTAFQLTPDMLDELERAAEAAQAQREDAPHQRTADVTEERQTSKPAAPLPASLSPKSSQTNLRTFFEGGVSSDEALQGDLRRSLRDLENRPRKRSLSTQDSWAALSTMPGFSIAEQSHARGEHALSLEPSEPRTSPGASTPSKSAPTPTDSLSAAVATANQPNHSLTSTTPPAPKGQSASPRMNGQETASPVTLPVIPSTVAQLTETLGEKAGAKWTWLAYAIRAGRAQRAASANLRVLSERASLLAAFRGELCVRLARRLWEEGSAPDGETGQAVRSLAEQSREVSVEYESLRSAAQAVQLDAAQAEKVGAAALNAAQSAQQEANKLYQRACLSRDVCRGELASIVAEIERLNRRPGSPTSSDASITATGGPGVEAQRSHLEEQRRVQETALAAQKKRVQERRAEEQSSRESLETLRQDLAQETRARRESIEANAKQLDEVGSRLTEIESTLEPLWRQLGEECLAIRGEPAERAAALWAKERVEADQRLRTEVTAFQATIDQRALQRGTQFGWALCGLGIVSGLVLWLALA